jgi:hypothetical protein
VLKEATPKVIIYNILFSNNNRADTGTCGVEAILARLIWDYEIIFSKYATSVEVIYIVE